MRFDCINSSSLPFYLLLIKQLYDCKPRQLLPPDPIIRSNIPRQIGAIQNVNRNFHIGPY